MEARCIEGPRLPWKILNVFYYPGGARNGDRMWSWTIWVYQLVYVFGGGAEDISADR